MEEQPNNPLHGVKLQDIVEYLVQFYGWEELGKRIDIRCFNLNPTVGSSLKFLRRTPWARNKVEKLYLDTQKSGKAMPNPPFPLKVKATPPPKAKEKPKAKKVNKPKGPVKTKETNSGSKYTLR
ncbi:Uncharacterized conserved protein [Lishizhenia tianjinensis]|uniref:Uncharacterized conserved protein n=1 Tax=Lishizhenia tianjinensis TaxID=477690 RepID=A0A1I6ZID4_9FLAO|nr:Uncharacterized conserved protein [Lishizhenia tianjinensis]